MIDELKCCPLAAGAKEILYPGELEWRREDMARAGKNAVVAKLAADDVTFFHLLAAEATKAMEADVAKAMKVFSMA